MARVRELEDKIHFLTHGAESATSSVEQLDSSGRGVG